MKQLTMFIAVNTDGGDRVTYYYDIIDKDTGRIIEEKKRDRFFVLDEGLRSYINSIRSYIRDRLNNPLCQVSSFMILHKDEADQISFTYNKLDSSGKIISMENKETFVVLDEELSAHVNSTKNYIQQTRLLNND